MIQKIMNQQSIKSESAPRRTSYKERLLKKKRLLTQSASTLTVAAALVSITQQAESAIVVHEYNSNLPSFSSFNPIEGILNPASGPDVFSLSASNGIEISAPINGDVTDDFVPLTFRIDSNSSFNNSSSFSESGLIGTTQFLGFKLDDQGVNDDETWFGWIEFRFNAVNDITLVRSAFDDTGGAITVPEPTTTMLGSLALVLTICFRKRRAA